MIDLYIFVSLLFFFSLSSYILLLLYLFLFGFPLIYFHIDVFIDFFRRFPFSNRRTIEIIFVVCCVHSINIKNCFLSTSNFLFFFFFVFCCCCCFFSILYLFYYIFVSYYFYKEGHTHLIENLFLIRRSGWWKINEYIREATENTKFQIQLHWKEIKIE